MRLVSQSKYLPPIKSSVNSSMISNGPIRSSSVDPLTKVKSRGIRENFSANNHASERKALENDDYYEDDEHQGEYTSEKEEKTFRPFNNTSDNQKTTNESHKQLEEKPVEHLKQTQTQKPSVESTANKNPEKQEPAEKKPLPQVKEIEHTEKNTLPQAHESKVEAETKEKDHEHIKTEEDFNGSYQE